MAGPLNVKNSVCNQLLIREQLRGNGKKSQHHKTSIGMKCLKWKCLPAAPVTTASVVKYQRVFFSDKISKQQWVDMLFELVGEQPLLWATTCPVLSTQRGQAGCESPIAVPRMRQGHTAGSTYI